MRTKRLDPTDNVWAKGLIHCYVCGLDLTGHGHFAQKYYSQQRPGVIAYAHSLGPSLQLDSCEAVLQKSDEWDREHPLDKAQREADKRFMKGATYYENRE